MRVIDSLVMLLVAIIGLGSNYHMAEAKYDKLVANKEICADFYLGYGDGILDCGSFENCCETCCLGENYEIGYILLEDCVCEKKGLKKQNESDKKYVRKLHFFDQEIEK